MKLDRSVSAVVTGATSGLGAAVAERLVARGVRVALFGRNEDAGAQLAQRLGALFCKVDVTSDDSVDAGFDMARARLGQERVLVNCAGVAFVCKAASRNRATQQTERFAARDFERLVQVNLVGTFRCITKSTAGMLDLEPTAQGVRGVILNTASIAAQDGKIGQSGYAASKAGIVGMTLPLMRDFMAEGIRVNTIMPGIFETAMLDDIPENLKAMMAASVPFPKRLGWATEFADLAEAIIANDYLNGESIRLDGGLRMGPR